MLKLIKNYKAASCSVATRLPYLSSRNSSNYHGTLNEFKLTDSDQKFNSPLQSFVDKYRKYGHHYSKVDPLELREKKSFPTLTDFKLDGSSSLKGALDTGSYISKLELASLSQLESFLAKAYTGAVGVEFDHVLNYEEREWLYNEYEKIMASEITKDEKKKILKLLTEGEAVDHFISKKYPTFKRYSGEGTESLLVALNTIFAGAAEQGVSDVVLAMPHRGRFNVLVELLDYPAAELFRKISSKSDLPYEFYTAIDDVTSHVAVSARKSYSRGHGDGSKEINVSMLHNPSHLEAVNPVSMGKTKAKQDEIEDINKILNVQLHGDAAFAGQGVIYESFAISRAPSFNINGTVHIICNNQIGFTTVPREGRSTQYSSDIVKAFGIPVIHVNADCPEDVLRVSELALKYRQKFKKDFMIDLIGYRRHGHNELDEPEFTQPHMYKKIRGAQITAPNLYHQSLVSSGVSTEGEIQEIREKIGQELETSYRARDNIEKTIDQITNPDFKGNRAFTGKWKGFTFSIHGKEGQTGYDSDLLKKFAQASVHTPSGFEVHPRIKKHHIEARLSQVDKNSVDWATAEAAAFASLLNEGYNIRFTGQDVERGTFSHRHLTMTDVKTEQKYQPFKHQNEHFKSKGRFHLHNSPLSEIGVLSYEFGYSMENPKNLVIWEAQFGDFFNPAQVTFDTYITCSEAKWARQSSLVCLLPHGMDGAGPEHSSCRIERFLQMGASDGLNRHLELRKHDPHRNRLSIQDEYFTENSQDVNFQFAQPSTPANYFHILRRQMMRNFRKPLILAAPKIVLKHPHAKSSFEEMGPNTAFTPVYAHGCSLDSAETVIFCTGKVNYDIRAHLAKAPAESQSRVAILVVEELLPFPEEIIKEKLSQVKKSAKIVWVQEETMNSGAYWYAEPRIARVLRELDFETPDVRGIARRAIAATAVGSGDYNSMEQRELAQAFTQCF